MADRTWDSYASVEALRGALEGRLADQARQRGIPVDRLRKEAAFHRLLARLDAPVGTSATASAVISSELSPAKPWRWSPDL